MQSSLQAQMTEIKRPAKNDGLNSATNGTSDTTQSGG